MEATDVTQLLSAIRSLVRPSLERSEPLRRIVSIVGTLLCEEAAAAAAATPSQPVAPSQQPTPATTPADPAPAPAAAPLPASAVEPKPAPVPRPVMLRAIVPLKLGDSLPVHLPVDGTTEELGRARQSAQPVEAEDGAHLDVEPLGEAVDLALVEKRTRLKAESCRLYVQKRAATNGSATEQSCKARMDAMLAKAKDLESCFLWVFWKQAEPPSDTLLEQIAECYEAQADAIGVYNTLIAHPALENEESLHDLFLLMAEANSALRASLKLTWLTEDDRDQADLHFWLRGQTRSRQIYVEKYMSANDRADPTKIKELRGRLRTYLGVLQQRIARLKDIKAALDKIRHHGRQIVKADGVDCGRDVQRICEAVKRLQGFGIAASDRRIGESLGTEAAKICRESDRAEFAALKDALASHLVCDEDDEDDRVAPAEYGAAVLAARNLLRGKRMVILGGVPQSRALDKLIEAFELADAEWVDLTEHGSSAPMHAPIARDDTAIVVVLIKFIGHLHAEEARAAAAAARKPCVHLPGGYNPNRVAAEILEQASDRLGG